MSSVYALKHLHDILTSKKRVTKCAFDVDPSTWGLMMVCIIEMCLCLSQSFTKAIENYIKLEVVLNN